MCSLEANSGGLEDAVADDEAAFFASWVGTGDIKHHHVAPRATLKTREERMPVDDLNVRVAHAFGGSDSAAFGDRVGGNLLE